MNASSQGQGVAPVSHPGHAANPIPHLIQNVTPSYLAEQIATRGEDDFGGCIRLAAAWHGGNGKPNPPTYDELCRRVHVDTMPEDYIDLYHQNLPNALALRLLAPNPGQNPGFEDQSTEENGEKDYKYKCLAPGCDFCGKDKDRHMHGQHVRDIDSAICCPYKGCKQIYYKTRVSQMTKHFKWHETKNRILRLQGKATIPIACFQRRVRRNLGI